MVCTRFKWNGPAEAAENYGIGEVITDWDDVAAGDFVQFGDIPALDIMLSLLIGSLIVMEIVSVFNTGQLQLHGWHQL